MTLLAQGHDVAPGVVNSLDRDARFPLPDIGQRIFNIEDGQFETWDGSTWTQTEFAIQMFDTIDGWYLPNAVVYVDTFTDSDATEIYDHVPETGFVDWHTGRGAETAGWRINASNQLEHYDATQFAIDYQIHCLLNLIDGGDNSILAHAPTLDNFEMYADIIGRNSGFGIKWQTNGDYNLLSFDSKEEKLQLHIVAVDNVADTVEIQFTFEDQHDLPLQSLSMSGANAWEDVPWDDAGMRLGVIVTDNVATAYVEDLGGGNRNTWSASLMTPTTDWRDTEKQDTLGAETRLIRHVHVGVARPSAFESGAYDKFVVLPNHTMLKTPGTTGDLGTWVVPQATNTSGDSLTTALWGISVHTPMTRSAGILTATVYVNGVATSVTTTIDSSATESNAAILSEGVDLSPGDDVTIRLSPDIDWRSNDTYEAEITASIMVQSS